MGQVLDEGPINLDFIQWELMDIAKGRIAGPEVVECNFNALCPDGIKGFDDRFGVCDEQRFGYFDLQALLGET